MRGAPAGAPAAAAAAATAVAVAAPGGPASAAAGVASMEAAPAHAGGSGPSAPRQWATSGAACAGGTGGGGAAEPPPATRPSPTAVVAASVAVAAAAAPPHTPAPLTAGRCGRPAMTALPATAAVWRRPLTGRACLRFAAPPRAPATRSTPVTAAGTVASSPVEASRYRRLGGGGANRGVLPAPSPRRHPDLLDVGARRVEGWRSQAVADSWPRPPGPHGPWPTEGGDGGSGGGVSGRSAGAGVSSGGGGGSECRLTLQIVYYRSTELMTHLLDPGPLLQCPALRFAGAARLLVRRRDAAVPFPCLFSIWTST